jgi:ABC-type sugar transport system ATPase subunit
MSAQAGAPVLEVRNATKRFGAVLALNDISLTLHDREVLALLGDNGAGKSTLIKAISGVHHLDEGEVLLGGEPVSLRTPADAREVGIETVYQDLALFDNLNASQNFYAGREVTRWPWLSGFALLRDRHMEQETARLLTTLEVRVPAGPSGLVGLMSGGQRQAVAVARAAAFASRIVILDEPTAALGVRESRNVLRLIARLADHGVSVILISHNLEDVMAVADRAVVLRQGAYVGEAIPTPENHETLVSMIVGASQETGAIQRSTEARRGSSDIANTLEEGI